MAPAIDRPSLRASVKEGAAHGVMLGAGDTYLNAFAIALHATAPQIALLSSIPPLCSAIAQALAVKVMESYRNRKGILLRLAQIQGIIWPLVGAVALLQDRPELIVPALLLLSVLNQFIGGMFTPIWSSLIGDLVPAEARGRFFGKRASNTLIATFLSMLIAGHALDLFTADGNQFLGFGLIFLAAGSARLFSIRFLKQHDNPELHFSKEHYFSFWNFISRAHRSNFAKFVFYVALIQFSVAIAGPFFSVYLLRELKVSYSQFTVLTVGTTILQFLTIQYWGRLTDRFGTKRILNISGIGLALCPILWLVSQNLIWIFSIQLYAGFIWAGFNLASSNFMYDAVSPPKRARCVAYQSIVTATLICIGATIGGYLARHMGNSLELLGATYTVSSPLLFLFLISGLLRLLASALFLPLFREVREVEPIKNSELLLLITNLRPLAGVTYTLFTGILKSRKRKK